MTARSLSLLLVLGLVLLTTPGASAQPGTPRGLTLSTGADGTLVHWEPPAAAALQDVGPAPAPQLFSVILPDGADPTPRVDTLATTVWTGDPPRAAALATRALPDGTIYRPLPGFAAEPAPTAPLALVREGRLRGRRIAIYALSPVYAGAGGPALVSSLRARIPGAAPLDAAPGWAAAPNAPFLSAAPAPDPIAAGQAWTIRVDQGGIQAISAAALTAAGLGLGGLDTSRLRLRHSGAIVPIEQIRSGGALRELRFYAPTPGDRNNSADTYWLTIEAQPGPAMAVADARPTAGAPGLTSAATQRGAWRISNFYDPQIAGPDGDHYFAAELRVAPAPAAPDIAAAAVVPTLPQPAGQVSLTVAGESLFSTTHTLSVTLAGSVRTSTWAGTSIFSRTMSFPAGSGQAALALVPGAAADGIHIDSVAWEAPATLSFAGGGATFEGRSGYWRYQLGGLPNDAALYDVSDPAAPIRLTIDAIVAGASSFEVDAATARSYLLAGPGTIQTPAIAAHAPVDLATPINAQALYIAPDAFVPTLVPLVAQRQAQGYRVAVVRASAIYDAWGGGQASPQAIRSFLRYAAATWAVKPIAVTLVGDGTSDPRNYMGIGQVSWLPPYLARVDPWLGETACENCFAQLDGDSPLDDWLPDLMIGRLPVKSAAELGQLVTKIIAYEQSRDVGAWRGRAAYLADNTDPAGDFSYAADQSIAGLPPTVGYTRVYYDPTPPAGEAWRVRDSFEAFQRTIATLNSGAAVLSYLGHGLQYQWAFTGPPLEATVPQDRQYLLNVDFAGDTTNGLRLPVVLSLTCLTGAFQQPSVRGTTIDEALLLNPHGGAIATWSSAGLGVLYGHDALQRGFLGKLWAPAAPPPTLGALTMAGYQELFATKGCCQESLRTYGLLGDPLTPIRVQTGVRELSLPMVRR